MLLSDLRCIHFNPAPTVSGFEETVRHSLEDTGRVLHGKRPEGGVESEALRGSH